MFPPQDVDVPLFPIQQAQHLPDLKWLLCHGSRVARRHRRKLAEFERKMVAVCGDAGFMMNVQDLETAAQLSLNIVVLIWLDSEYGLIK